MVIVVLFYFKLLTTSEKTLAVLSFIIIGGNFAELLGNKISVFLDNNSFVAIGALLLIFVYSQLIVKLKDIQTTSNTGSSVAK
jgi:hypothetical protein